MAAGFKKWFQRSPTLENPYMGQAMSTCGSSSSWGAAVSGAGAEPAIVSHEGHGHDADDVSHYTCSMHPSVRRDAPGTCPICGMALSPVTFDEQETGVVRIDEARGREIGIRTGKVERAPMKRTLRAVGRVAYDETRLRDVTLKLGGWITKLHVTQTGQPIRQGQMLFTLYSPELFAAQQEYLLARGRNDALAGAAEKKLSLWGLTSAQIAKVAEKGEPLENVPFYAPASGYVIEKNVVEGAAVQAGERLFRIAALDKVWVEAELFEADLPSVKVGGPATVELSYLPGATFEGKVTYVYPYLDPVARTGKVRVELRNAGRELKPDMYATILFDVDLGSRLQIPIDAVVYTGPRRLVFVDLGEGRLRPQEVTLGARTDDKVEVLSGLSEGQTVVTSGNFLVAAESRIRSAAKFWTEERAGGQP
jgi:Cu(I)/Ag(I) efflux system membrane fusion protein